MIDIESDLTWLTQDALTVAPRLLGCQLISRTPAGETGGRIVEVEAYHGVQDPASHAYRGRTARNAPMFEAAGAIYVYFTYGMHTCVNLVTGPAGEAQAVLIRALEPTRGLELMRTRRAGRELTQLTNGPAKLTQALGLTLTQSGSHLGDQLILHPPADPVDPALIRTGPRIGIKQATDLPWRFWLASNPFVSRTRS